MKIFWINILIFLAINNVYSSDKYRDEQALAAANNFSSKKQDIPESSQIRHPIPTDPLTDRDLEFLQNEYYKHVKNKNDFENLVLINNNELFYQMFSNLSLSSVSRQDFEKFTLFKGLVHQKKTIKLMQDFSQAISSIYDLISDLQNYGLHLRYKQNMKSLKTDSEFAIGSHKSSNLDYEEFYLIIPILQKIMISIAGFKKIQDQEYALLQTMHKNKFIGYIKGYLPFSYNLDDGDSLYKLPIKAYLGQDQSVVFIQDKEIQTDSGLVICNRSSAAYNLSSDDFYRVSFILGIETLYPFTITPYELNSSKGIKKDNQGFNNFRKFFESEFPKEGHLGFVPLAVTEVDKNIFEVFFLENIKDQAKKDDVDAIQMLIYIEQESDQSIDDLIAEKKKQLLTEHLSIQQMIVEEQSKISQDVSQGLIAGKLKGKKSTTVKSNKTKTAYSTQKKNGSSSQNLSFTNSTRSQSKPIAFKDMLDAKRVKYRKMLGVVNKIMKHAINNNLLQSTRGSHQTLHTDAGAVTLVRPHGGKDSLTRSSSKRFYEKLTSMIQL